MTEIIRVIERGPQGPKGEAGEISALEHNTTFGEATLGPNGVGLEVSTIWGIDTDGNPYYDAEGVTDPDEQAVLILTDAGDFALVAI